MASFFCAYMSLTRNPSGQGYSAKPHQATQSSPVRTAKSGSQMASFFFVHCSQKGNGLKTNVSNPSIKKMKMDALRNLNSLYSVKTNVFRAVLRPGQVAVTTMLSAWVPARRMANMPPLKRVRWSVTFSSSEL